MRTWLFGILLAALAFSSCKEKPAEEDYSKETGSYFSVRQYALDQWNTFMGEPFLIVKTVRVNDGKWDSSYTNSDTLDWGAIFHEFFLTEISDRQFLGKYKFTQFDDNEDETHNFFYEAKEEDLYTRKLLLTIDQYNQMVRGIYIEAAKSSPFEERLVKLYYKPMKRIQIQETVKPLFGASKHTVTEYEFLRG